MQYLGGHWGCVNLARGTGHLEDPSWQKGSPGGRKRAHLLAGAFRPGRAHLNSWLIDVRSHVRIISSMLNDRWLTIYEIVL